jgi:DNA adenine methylase
MGDSVQSPIKWHGGKSYLADWIISYMPPHVHYVEPYAGGLSVLFRKPHEGVSEVVNDLDGKLMNFWRVLQSPMMFRTFARRVEAIPLSQVEFEKAKTDSVDTQIAHAVAFFVRCRQSRQGLQRDFATLSRNRTRRGMNEQASAWWSAVDGLEDAYLRLRRVVLLNDDALSVIQQQDGPNTLFYLDPPYLHETRVTTGEYEFEMTPADHDELLETLAGIEGKFILSGYPSDKYSNFAGRHSWYSVSRMIDCKASGKSQKSMRTEVLWMNFVPGK